jgi:hypothetical protein
MHNVHRAVTLAACLPVFLMSIISNKTGIIRTFACCLPKRDSYEADSAYGYHIDHHCLMMEGIASETKLFTRHPYAGN